MRKQILTAHAVVVVPMPDTTFVFIQESKAECRGRWSPPGGMLEPGESIFDAGVREVYEEAGIDVTPIGLLKLEHFRYVSGVKGPPAEKFRHIIVARYLSGALKVASDGESMGAKSVSLNEAERLDFRDARCLNWLKSVQTDATLLPINQYQFLLV